MSNDTRLLCGWTDGGLCHLPPGHSGEEHWTVEGGTEEALEAEVRRLRVENRSLVTALRSVAAGAEAAAGASLDQ